MLFDCYGYFICNRCNLQLSGCSCDRIVICKCVFIQSISFKCIIALAYNSLTSSYIIRCRAFTSCESFSANRYFVILKRLSVIWLLIGCRSQGYSSLRNYKCSIFNHELNILKVITDVSKIVSYQIHIICSGIDSAYSLMCFVTCKCKIIFGIRRIADACHLITCNILFRSIIFCCVTIFSDGYCYFISNWCNFQLSILSFDLVVISICAIL